LEAELKKAQDTAQTAQKNADLAVSVFSAEGISASSYASAPEFKGSRDK
jgi:hypothetical protein